VDTIWTPGRQVNEIQHVRLDAHVWYEVSRALKRAAIPLDITCTSIFRNLLRLFRNK